MAEWANLKKKTLNLWLQRKMEQRISLAQTRLLLSRSRLMALSSLSRKSLNLWRVKLWKSRTWRTFFLLWRTKQKNKKTKRMKSSPQLSKTSRTCSNWTPAYKRWQLTKASSLNTKKNSKRGLMKSSKLWLKRTSNYKRAFRSFRCNFRINRKHWINNSKIRLHCNQTWKN